MRPYRRSSRSRFTWGILLLGFGAFALAYNLGLRVPRDLWDYWPALIIGFGVIQAAWPGTLRERLGGGWLIAVGVYCWISNFEVFGLDWGTSWPLLIVAIGLRIVLGGIFREELKEPGKEGEQSNQGGTP